MKRFEGLLRKINYQFHNIDLLSLALTHSSASNNKTGDNERLEFLGDAVLELCATDFLYHQYAHLNEGALSKLRAKVVCEDALYEAAEELGLGEYLLMSGGEEHTGGRHKPSILSDAMEALIGALYLDGGIEVANSLIMQYLPEAVELGLQGKQTDYKTQLQEHLQREGNVSIRYEIVDIQGPDHDRYFQAEVSVNGEIVGHGEGKNKKAAEQAAAENYFVKLEQDC